MAVVGSSLIFLFVLLLWLLAGLLRLFSLLESLLFGLLLGFRRWIRLGLLDLLKLGIFGRSITSVWSFFRVDLRLLLMMRWLEGMFSWLGRVGQPQLRTR